MPDSMMTWKVAQKRARIVPVRVQFCAQYSIPAKDAEEKFCCNQHAKGRCGEVEPFRSPDVCKAGRTRGAGRVDAET